MLFRSLPDGVVFAHDAGEVADLLRLAAVVSGKLEHLGAGGGHPLMLNDLKSLLETGHTLREGRGQGGH